MFSLALMSTWLQVGAPKPIISKSIVRMATDEPPSLGAVQITEGAAKLSRLLPTSLGLISPRIYR
jgi:hypothetical protein